VVADRSHVLLPWSQSQRGRRCSHLTAQEVSRPIALVAACVFVKVLYSPLALQASMASPRWVAVRACASRCSPLLSAIRLPASCFTVGAAVSVSGCSDVTDLVSDCWHSQPPCTGPPSRQPTGSASSSTGPLPIIITVKTHTLRRILLLLHPMLQVMLSLAHLLHVLFVVVLGQSNSLERC
jgi:hypothetical protein